MQNQTTAKGKFFGYKFCHFFIMMLVFSFLGYILESTFKVLTSGAFDNNHHFFPATFTYGLIILTLFSFLGTPDDMRFLTLKLFRSDGRGAVDKETDGQEGETDGKAKRRGRGRKAAAYITYAILLALGVFFGEMLVGMINYKLTGAAIWNYNFIPLNVKWFGCDVAFTSIPTTAAFTAAGWLFMKFAFTPIMNAISRIPVRTAVAICIAVGVPLICDYVFSLVYTQIYGKCPLYWTISFNTSPPSFRWNKNIF